MSGIGKANNVNQTDSTAFVNKQDSLVNNKKTESHSRLIFGLKKQENLQKQIDELKKQIKNFKAVTPEQYTQKTQMETLLGLYEEQMKELKKEQEPKFNGLN